MHELLELERALAGVMSLADLAGPVSRQVQRLAGASGSAVFHFLEPGVISIQEGQGADVLAGYTPDLGAEDLTQPFNLATPPTAFIPSSEGFDFDCFVRSRPYTDFY